MKFKRWGGVRPEPFRPSAFDLCVEAWIWLRTFLPAHPVLVTAVVVLGLIGALLLYREWLKLRAALLGYLAPGTFRPEVHGFPLKAVDLMRELARRPKGLAFVGITPRRRSVLPGWTWDPVYLSEKQRTMHRHVLGKTGSGKTLGVLWPQVLQDTLDGKGVMVIDAKGSDENVRTMKAIAAVAGRRTDLRVVSLPAWNVPELFTHSYNLAWVQPRCVAGGSLGRGGDAVAMSERLLSALPISDNEYFWVQSRQCLTQLCRLLHGMVDDAGNGYPFNVLDISICLRGIADSGACGRALNHCLEHSVDRDAAALLVAQFRRLGSKVHEVLSGLSGGVDQFLAPMVNAYAPDLVLEDALERNLLVYVQLPSNLFKEQAPALGKAILMDLQQAASMRQVFRRTRNQRPFSVVIDEFATFADLSFLDSLNKLRDANIQFTLAHQSLADLELVDEKFARAVWDNTLTKDLLGQDDPDLCERIAKSLGTKQVIERTARVAPGPLLTEGATGEASTRLVETYRVHPNALKALQPCGQGYVVGCARVGKAPKDGERKALPVCYPELPKELQQGADYRLEAVDQRAARGLRLQELFLGQGRRTEPASEGGVPLRRPRAKVGS